MPINMDEKTHEELCYQLERCDFALTTMVTDIKYLWDALNTESANHGEWPEEADIMLEEMANAIGTADDKVCEIVTQIKRYID